MGSGGANGGRRRGAGVDLRRSKQRAFLIAAGPDPEQGLDELTELMETAGAETVGRSTQTRSRPHPDSYVGPGRAAEMALELGSCDANLVVCDDELSPRQERTLERILGKPVIDRTAVILDIFALHAGSSEGKLQVELAQLEYNLARMRGLWTHLERLGGGIGTRGPGESQLETDRRLARDRIAALRRRIQGVGAARDRLRAERERNSVPSLALVGYTNAGKSTLMNRLTGSKVGVRDELFHTLEPTTRTFEHRGRNYVVTDTVGFIRKLPHQLVEAFAATLEEAAHADLLLVVSDGSQEPDELRRQRTAVDETLDSIGAGHLPRLDVINKVDLIGPLERENLRSSNPSALLLSARTGEGVELLADAAAAAIGASLTPVDLLIPHGEGSVLGELHRLAGDLEREDTAEGVRMRARLNAAQASRYGRFMIEDCK